MAGHRQRAERGSCHFDWREQRGDGHSCLRHRENGNGYVVEDASGRFQPAEWACKAIPIYWKWQADRIVAEVNQGGAMVESTLRAVDSSIPYRGVHAKRGKIVRAEPISALYEQGRVKHAGIFTDLEDQMCTYAGGGDSPDRLDATVYALSDLMLGYGAQPVPIGMVEAQARAYADPRPFGFTVRTS
jgi:phage terminase large subunit-like protein